MQQRHKLLAQLHGNGALPDQQEINTYVARAVNKSGTRGDTLDVLFAALDNSGTAEATGAELKRVIARHRGAAKRKALAADLGRWFYEKRVRGYQASSRRDDLLQRLRDALPEDAVEAFDQTVLRCAAKDQTAAAAVLALLHEIDPTPVLPGSEAGDFCVQTALAFQASGMLMTPAAASSMKGLVLKALKSRNMRSVAFGLLLVITGAEVFASDPDVTELVQHLWQGRTRYSEVAALMQAAHTLLKLEV